MVEYLLLFGGIILIGALIYWIWDYLTNKLPTQRRRQYFNEIFHTMKFKSVDGKLPYFLEEKRVSDSTMILSFNTLIPLKVWNAKKDILDMQINSTIVDITQDEENKRIINLFTQVKPLPKLVNWDDKYEGQNNTFNIGVSRYGFVGMDLDKYAHAFIAGETGCGKSNILKCFIRQAIIKKYDVILIDFKRGVSFSAFKNELMIYYEYKNIIGVFTDLVTETKLRLDKFRELDVDNINDYNNISSKGLKRKIVFIDELAELLATRDKEISNILYDSIETLTRLSRAAGIHLIMGIQRPDSTIINGQIKSNVSYRISGRFPDKEPSRIMLGSEIASSLPNKMKGRVIVKDDSFHEVQCFRFYKARNTPTSVKEEAPPIESTQAHETEIEPDNVIIKEEPKSAPHKVIDKSSLFDFSEFRK